MSEPVRTRFRSHVGDCPNCEAFLAQYETTIDLCREQREQKEFEPPAELIERTLSFLRSRYEEEG